MTSEISCDGVGEGLTAVLAVGEAGADADGDGDADGSSAVGAQPNSRLISRSPASTDAKPRLFLVFFIMHLPFLFASLPHQNGEGRTAFRIAVLPSPVKLKKPCEDRKNQ